MKVGPPAVGMRRQWRLILAAVGFIAFNLFLWSLPLSQLLLFTVSLPSGIAGLVGFFRLAALGHREHVS